MSRKRFIRLTAAFPLGASVLAACGVNIGGRDLEDPRDNSGRIVNSATQNSPTEISGDSPRIPSNLPKKGPAPQWNNATWINSEPLTLNQLQGKVILVEFWTFGCYNCQNVIPNLKSWYDDYATRGLEIIGFHTPEFDYEKKLENVQQAVKQRQLKYPVALDNDFNTWNKFGVRAWPSLFLVDKQGFIRYSHIGEGGYDQTRSAIEGLLKE